MAGSAVRFDGLREGLIKRCEDIRAAVGSVVVTSVVRPTGASVTGPDTTFGICEDSAMVPAKKRNFPEPAPNL